MRITRGSMIIIIMNIVDKKILVSFFSLVSTWIRSYKPPEFAFENLQDTQRKTSMINVLTYLHN